MKNNSRYLIVVDTREYASSLGKKIVGYLKQDRNIKVEVDLLEVGDYFIPGNVNNILIERKSVLDLLNAAKTKRLWNQLKMLVSVENAEPYLLLEGTDGMVKKFTKWSLEAFEGLKLAILNSFGIKIIPSSSYGFTAIILKVLIKQQQAIEKPKRKQLKVQKLADTPQQQAVYVLSSFPGINYNRARQILRKFGSLMDALSNTYAWKTIKGIGHKTIKKVEEVLNARF